jgi:hypothetical protein
MPGITIGGSAFGLGDYITPAGRLKRGAEQQQREQAEVLSNMAQDLWRDTETLRAQGAGQLEDFLGTGDVPAGLALSRPELFGLNAFMRTGTLPRAVALEDTYAPVRDTLEAQFQRAREATISGSPGPDGRLAAGLRQLEADRAFGVTNIEAARAREANALRQRLYSTGLDISQTQAQRENALRQGLYSQALGVAFQQAPSLALQGEAGSAGAYGNIAMRALQEQLAREEASREKAGTIAGMGMGMGGMGGGGGGGKAGGMGGGVGMG